MRQHPSRSAVADDVRQRFAEEFGGAPERVVFAPGRVNLVGAHLDYNGGDVLPVALNRGVWVAARRAAGSALRLRSLDQPLAVDVPAAAIGERRDPAHGWASYPIGVWRAFAARTGARDAVELVYGGDLPIASGLSSSAAIEVATAFALDRLHGTRLPAADLGLLGYEAENGYVGLKCGIMDQFASALGQAGHVLLLHCHARTWEHVPVPDGFEVLVLDTRKPRQLAGSGFNERVRECAEAHAILRRHVRDEPYLAAYRSEDLDAAGDALGGALLRRARHVVTEMTRVAQAAAALRRDDLGALGAAMNGSHASARDDYQVSCDELDVITQSAREHPACHGARLTGAGFGGCGIALIRAGSADAVIAKVRATFVARFGVEPQFHVVGAGPGPHEVG